MAPRRFPARFRIGLLLAGAALGAFLTATPRAGQQLPEMQVGSRAVQVPTTPTVSTVSVPRVSVPVVAPVVGAPVVVVPRVAAPIMSAPGEGVPGEGVPGEGVLREAVPRAPKQPPQSPNLEQMGSHRLTAARAEAFVQAARLGVNYLPGEVLVKFKPGMGPAEQNRALQALRARPAADSLEWRGEVAIVRDDTQPDAHILADQLNGQPEVEYAEPNFIRKIDPLVRESATTVTPPARVFARRPNRGAARINVMPTDPYYLAYQWNFALINMPGAWDLQPGGRSDLIVAVIDTGITGAATNMTFPLWTGSSFQNVSLPYAVNPDLPASRHVLPRDYAFLNPDGPVVDMQGHGTHVSGTIGEATSNGLLVAGMAYNVKIMPVKVCTDYWEIMIARAQAGISGFAPSDSGGCADADIADGVRYAADNGAKVMNISLGGEGSTATVQSALAYAAGKGAFIAISMGNDFEDGNPTIYPAAFAPGINGVMSVASIGWNQQKAYYSSTGSYCEIAAPGGDARSGAGRTDAGRIWQSTLRPSDLSESLTIPRFDRYDIVGYQGTSMAAPHVAGLAALLMSQMPGLTPAQVEGIIRTSARDLGSPGKDDSFGYGLIQPRAALFGQGIRR